VVIRCPGINRPLVGNFATKNIVYAMIARNWAEGRASLAYPTLDCLRGGKRSLHMLEFPVSAYLTAWLWRTGGGSLDVWGRATAVAFSAASVAVLVLLVRRRHGPQAALGAGCMLAMSPVGVIYGQSFMLEASLVFFTLAAVDGLDRWLDGGWWGWLTASVLALALLLLTKIYMLVLLVPLGAAIYRAGVKKDRLLTVVLVGLAILPAAAWYLHAYRTADPLGPHGDQIFYSVRQGALAHCPPHPLLYSVDFYGQGLGDLAGVVLTPLGFVLLVVGFGDRCWRRYLPWLLASAVLVAALPRKFHEMNYYYLAVLPPLAVIAGLGWQWIHRRVRCPRLAAVGFLLVGLLFSIRYSLRPAFATPEEDRAVVAAGRAVRELTAPEEPVVTMHGTTIDLVYYSRRPGWAVGPDTVDLERVLEDCRRQGGRYLVIAGPDSAAPPPAVRQKCVPEVEGDGFGVYRLTPAGVAETRQ
jgi:hypothetical protein